MGENIDRISDLPDAILLKILSPFPMKFLIRTSVLSKRWKNLWKSNPNLDFDIDLWDPYLFVPEELRTNKKRTEFVSFIEQFLHCYEPGAKINRFRLFFFPDKCHRLQTTKWIQFALARGAEELDLNFFMMNQEMFKLSPFLFDHGSMSVLKLNYCDFSPPLSFKGLSSLKILVLRDLKITSDVIASVVCNCPLLESLTVKECYQLLELSIPSSGFRFKSLTVAGCLGLMKLEIYTPNLQSLHYSGKYIELFLENVSCLSDALFNIVLIKVNINPKDGCVEEVHHDPKPLLSEISHVKILTMSGWFVQFIFTVQHIFEHPTIVTMFHNLKELQLPMGEITKWDVLAISCFLQKCPWLEKLFIDIKTGDGAQQYASFWQSDYYGDYEPFDSVLGDLKMIKIKGFTGRKQEMRLVKYFLRKAVMLNLLILIPAQDYEGENIIEDVVRDLKVNLQLSGMRSLGDQLMLLQKASSGAKIVVYEYSEDHYEAYRPTHTEVYRPKSKDHF